MKYPFLAETKKGVAINLHVVPKASKTAMNGTHGDSLKLRVQAPPVDGKANKAVIAYLSSLFSIPKSDVVLKSGASSRKKTFILKGITLDQAQRILGNKI